MTFLLDALPNRMICEGILVNTDGVLEETEVFSVTLAPSSSDSAVSILSNGSMANVEIIDSTGMSEIQHL